ncbi:hypothetical protein [Sorangium sp. So ce542]|uniref:hypothetical protein n=1 Tax=Sorangium sp. So ce542 TaxID=3133316 RepID=UPI003F5DEBFD
MNRIVLLPLGVVVLAAAAWGAARQRDIDASVRGLSEAVARAEQSAESASSRVERLRGSVLAAQRPPRGRDVPGSDEPRDALEAVADPDLGSSEQASPSDERAPARGAGQEAGAVTAERVLEETSRQFDAEPIDPRWAGDARADVERAIEPLLSASVNVRSVSCKTSMCRLEAVHEDMDGYSAFMDQVLRSEICRNCFVTKTGEEQDGSLAMTLFLAREGRALPRVAAAERTP